MTPSAVAVNTVRIMELRGTYKGGGGPDKTILLSARDHDAERFLVLVTYLRSPDDDEFQIGEKAQELGLRRYVEVLDRRLLDLSCLFQLSALVRKYKIQIIHVHDLKSSLYGLLLKALHPSVKIMNTAHGWIANSAADRLKLKVQAWILRAYPLHIAVSKATRAILLDIGIPANNIKLLYNAIDIDFWQRNGKPSTIRNEFGIKADALIVGSIGRLAPEKDLPTLLRVAQKVLQTYPYTRFIIAGDGKQDEFTHYRNLADELGIGHAVIFTGHRTDLKNLYSSFDLFLMTSLTEGLPNVVLEAMAIEVPVVTTDVGGVPELVIDEKTGYLCKTGDIDTLSRRVAGLLEDSKKRELFSLMARDRIVKHFSFTERTKRIEQFYYDMATT